MRAAEVFVGRRRGRRSAARHAGLRVVAVDDVVLLGQRHARRVADLVAHGHEHQRAAAALLRVDPGDGASGARPRRRRAAAARTAKPAARPHAARQRHRRQEAAALRMAVGADLALRRLGQEVQPVPQRRQRRAGHRRGIVGRSSVADRPASGAAVRVSRRVSLLPTQSLRWSRDRLSVGVEVAVMARFVGLSVRGRKFAPRGPARQFPIVEGPLRSWSSRAGQAVGDGPERRIVGAVGAKARQHVALRPRRGKRPGRQCHLAGEPHCR